MILEFFTGPAVIAFFQVVMIDLVLAGDNAVVIGLAAAGLPKDQRAKAIFIGIAAATVMRIAFAAVTAQLLAMVGLLLAGGILLLWVCWKMWRELRAPQHQGENALEGERVDRKQVPRKTLRQAATQIIIADVSMSLDNVLAVAGAAREHPYILIGGLMLSIALMAFAASYIARLLERWRWIAYIGLVIILYVALQMTYTGALEVWPFLFEAKP